MKETLLGICIILIAFLTLPFAFSLADLMIGRHLVIHTIVFPLYALAWIGYMAFSPSDISLTHGCEASYDIE